jgi:hypothetical protein
MGVIFTGLLEMPPLITSTEYVEVEFAMAVGKPKSIFSVAPSHASMRDGVNVVEYPLPLIWMVEELPMPVPTTTTLIPGLGPPLSMTEVGSMWG